MGAQGTATIDFGAFPGASDTSVTVTGQASILAGSLVEAWIFPADTADHSADEHMVEQIRVFAGNVVAGVGFTIYAFNANQINEPLEYIGGTNNRTLAGRLTNSQSFQSPTKGGMGTLIYGQWNIGWVWN